MKSGYITTFAATVFSFLVTSAHAQVSWGGLHTISGDSDISLAGTYVDAAGNLSGGGVTVDDNGTDVDFHGLTYNSTTNTYSDITDDIHGNYLSGNITFSSIVSDAGGDSYTGGASIPTDYSAAMAGTAYTGNGQGGPTGTVTLSHLVAGDEYLVEVWQARTGDPSRDTTFSSAGGTPSPTTTGGNWLTGTFDAGSDSQAFTFTGLTGELNTVELRDLGAAPEPSTWAMLGVGLFGLLAWQRTRRA